MVPVAGHFRSIVVECSCRPSTHFAADETFKFQAALRKAKEYQARSQSLEELTSSVNLKNSSPSTRKWRKSSFFYKEAYDRAAQV